MGAECSRCGNDIYDECHYCKVKDENIKLQAALAGLLTAFSRMPDAGLTADDPRQKWWYETISVRDHARSLLP